MFCHGILSDNKKIVYTQYSILHVNKNVNKLRGIGFPTFYFDKAEFKFKSEV